jgi:hypothetical protein
MKILVLMLVALTGCANCTSARSGDPAPVIHPQPGKELCATACTTMTDKLVNEDGGVGCEEALPVPTAPGTGDVECVPGGPKDCLSCKTFCEQMHDDGAFWNTTCIISDITTCEQIETVCNTQ